MQTFSALLLAAATATAVTSAAGIAQAKDGVSVQIGPGGVSVGIGERGHHRGRHLDWGPGFYFYDGHYHGDCRWLRRRAEDTGSRTWWQRYRACRNS